MERVAQLSLHSNVHLIPDEFDSLYSPGFRSTNHPKNRLNMSINWPVSFKQMLDFSVQAIESIRILMFASFHKSKEEISEEYKILQKSMKNPHHFAPIYDKYYNEIFGFIFKRIADEDITADVTSTVFYKALYNLPKFKFRGLPFSSWLYRIAINAVNEHFRKEKKHTRYISVEPEQVGSFFMDLNLDQKQDSEVIVVELLGMLKPIELQIIELRFFENCSYREIGDILGMTETNSKTKTFRILKKLKQFYDSKWQR